MTSARVTARLHPRTAIIVTLGLLLAACAGAKNSASGTKASPTPSAAATSSSPTPPAPPPPSPTTCPLTGQTVASVPHRPALAIKVDNSPQARPQYGIDGADLVYEEPVEGGITRYVVVYQCHGASRVEPVRSARQADPYIVNQWGKTLFGNAGGSPPTLKAIDAAVKANWIVNVGYSTGGGYSRDPDRAGPSNLETSTQALYSRPDAKIANTATPIFNYSANPAPGTPGTTIHVDFSQYSDVTWQWNASAGAYQRYYNGTTPSNESDGSIMSTPNLIVQAVSVSMSWWVEDSSGSHQPIAALIGTGNALVCRQGTCVPGTWSRPSPSQPAQYLDSSGAPVALVPGQTWVELLPASVTGTGPIPVGQLAWH